MLSRPSVPTGWLSAALVFAIPVAPASAQRKPPLEFTQQSVLVGNFWVAGKETPSQAKNDLKLGREVGDGVRKRLSDLVDKRETKVIDGYDMRESLIRAAFSPDEPFTIEALRQQGQTFRTDEIVWGVATPVPGGGVKLDANLVLYRDVRMRQPIPPVTNRSVDRATSQLATRINEARVQLKFQRRCENFLRDANGARAIQAAREGISAYSNGVLVRTCLIAALRYTGAPAALLLAEAQALLEINPVAPHALEAAAVALDTLKRRAEAAEMWLRLYATDSTNLDLVERIAWSMAQAGNSRRAEPLIVRLSDGYPDNMRLMRQKWRIANDNRNWPLAVAAGEKLLAFDAEALTDSIFFHRFAAAYRANGQIYKAMELVARGVATFPSDPQLYALYTQFVKEESDTVLSRGLALHPSSAELQALNAKDLRARGQIAAALDASKKAVELDSTITQGRLFVAQGEMELGRPDSALATLWRAVAAGEERNAIAAFALAKGNTLLRAANATELRADFQLAMRFISLADSLKSTPQTKFLLGAAALKVAQTALTDAPKIAVKEESCAVSRLGLDTIPIARASLMASQDVAPDAIKEFLAYLDEIGPYADKQIAAFCDPGPTSQKPD
ncbi:MAG: tetratricopeptide repeat protein [Gemmatimonadaceae bacterium]